MVLYSPTVTGSLTLAGGTITVSGSSINNLTASFATTASFALNAGGGAGFPFIGAGNITGSLVISSSNASSSLVLRGSGSGVFTVDGTSGRLFSVDDSLSGSLFSVNTTAGLPVMEAFSDNTVRIGQYNRRALFVSQSVVGINKETALNGVLDISGSAAVTGSLIVSGSINTVGDISGSNARFTGTITAQTLVVQTVTSSVSFITGSTRFGSLATNTHLFTGAVSITGSTAVTGSIESTGPVYSVGENRMSQGTFNDPVPNTNAVLKLSAIPAVGLATTVIGARISGSASSNVDTYAGYFNNISTVSGTGLAYGIFASGSFHNFGGETRFYQGTFNDPIVGTAASVKISAVPTTGYPSSVFTVGITGAASSGQNTFAGYFTNTSTVSGGGVNYGIYATGSRHFFGGNVGIGTTSPGYTAASRQVVAINGGSAAAQGSILAFMQAGVNKGYVFSIQDDMELWCESGELRIGNNAAANIVFKTNNTDRMTISGSNGNVGIGTNSPTEKLDVIGGAVAAGNGTIRTGITYSTLGLIGTFTNHDLGIITNGTTKMFISASGNVGIGASTTPVYMLEVSSTGGSQRIRVGTLQNNDNTPKFEAITSNGVSIANSAWLKVNDGSGLTLGQSAYTKTGGDSGNFANLSSEVETPLLTFNSANAATFVSSINSLGINTAPTSVGTSANYLEFRNTGGDFYIGQEGSTGGGFFTGAKAYDNVFYGVTSYNFIINGSSKLFISSSGLVGINTSTPNARLDLGSSYGASGEKFLIYNDDTSSALAGTKMGFYIDRFSETNSITFVFPYAPASTSRYHIAYKDTSNTTLVDLAYLNYNSTAWVFPSDERMKNVEGIIPNALDKIKDLRAVYYTQKRDPEQKRKVGLLAQDLLKILPEVVDVPDTELDSEGNQRYMSVALADTIPLLLKAIQELKAEFDEYKSTHP